MCKEPATANDVHAAMPHPVVGSAADPIALQPVDDVVVKLSALEPGHIHEPAVMALERDCHRGGRAVAVLGDDEVCLARAR